MDELDKKIVRCLSENARMTVKDIARRVCLTSPAVSERIRRLEKAGTIAGYTVLLGRQGGPGAIEALEKLITTFQQLGHTSSQIILSTPVDRHTPPEYEEELP